ncbi:MAG: serine hydrolase, partial [Planctomycetota bacterium]
MILRKTLIMLLSSLLFLLGLSQPVLEACDTWVALPDATLSGHTLLGKNSDRVNFDCQPLLLHARAEWPAGAMIDLGRVKIPQVGETFATLGSSPYWCWGYEEGINEFGVAIGNEGIRTKVFTEDLETHRRNLGPEFGPTGMDLIRLGLERGRTAFEALNVICGLVEEYGQYGSGLPTMPAMFGGYHNSFIIADAREAWILETAGTHWVARRVDQGVASISNTLSITTNWDLTSAELVAHAEDKGWWSERGSEVFNFLQAYLDESPRGRMGQDLSVPRAECSRKLMAEKEGEVTVRRMMLIARDRSSVPAIDQDVTASSCVAELPPDGKGIPVFWWCPAVPSTSCYIPFFVHSSKLPKSVSKAGTFGRKITPPRETLPDKYSDDSYWWRFRDLCDKVRADYEVRNPVVRSEFDALEKAFEAELPDIVAKAHSLRVQGKAEAAAQVLDAFTAACVEKVLARVDALCAQFDGKQIADSGDDASPSLAVRLDRLAERLEEHCIKQHIPGMAIAVVKDDEVILARGFGMANLEAERPATEETLFAVGSTSKAFTATLIGMLVDEGKLDWDDPVTRFLPAFVPPIDTDEEGAQILIRDMLCHRTGFTRMGMLFGNGKVPRDLIFEVALRAKPWAKFREKFLYNNIMYLAAGTAAEKAGGGTWSALIEDRIFKPLSMDDACTSVSDLREDPCFATGYLWDEIKEEYRPLEARDLDCVAPAGAINANVLDMAKWIRFQLGRGVFEGKRLISEANLKETWTTQIDIGGGLSYGLGWMLGEWQCQPEVQHGGNIDGFAAQVALLPESNLGFVLLMNVGYSPLQKSCMAMVWETLLGEWKEAGPLEEDVDYKPYLGKYIANFGQFKDTEYTVKIQNGRLAIDVPGQTVYELKNPNAEGKWLFAISDQIAVSFVRDDTGRIIAMKQYQGGFEMELPRADVEMLPEVPLKDLEKYLGSYYSEEMDETTQMVIKRNCLAFKVPGKKTYMLRAPDEEGRWCFRVLDKIFITFEEDESGRVVGLAYNEFGKEIKGVRVEGEAEAPEPLPSLDEILALRKTDVRKQAWEKVNTFKREGIVRFEQAGIEGKLTWFVSGPDRFRQDMDLNAFGCMRSAVNEKAAWSEAPSGRVDELSGKYRTQELLAHPWAFHGDWRDYFEKIVVLEPVKLKDRKTYRLNLEAKGLPAYTVYVDAETGDVMKADLSMVQPGLDLSMPVTTFFDDFAEKEGLRLPDRIIASSDYMGRIVFEFDGMETGIELEEAIFTQTSVEKPREGVLLTPEERQRNV